MYYTAPINGYNQRLEQLHPLTPLAGGSAGVLKAIGLTSSFSCSVRIWEYSGVSES